MTTTSAEPAAAQEQPDTASLAQRVLTLPPALGLPAELYAKRVQGRVRLQRTAFTLDPHAALSTNTYFGRVPASYWQRWTGVTEVTFEAEYAGTGVVELFASDFAGEERTVGGQALDGEGRVRLTVAVDKFVDGGAVWADFRAGEAELSVSGARWTIPHPPRPRRTSVVICTHNRPTDCVKTLQALAADLPALDALDTVYVVDQGDKRVSAQPEFAQISADLAGRLRYITQANLGGAGGFTRGMYEIAEVQAEHHANILFMDDDIVLEPESIIRLTAFANSARQPIIVGAQMLYALHPKRLHTGAEYADLSTLEAGKVVSGALWNEDMTEENQEVRVDAVYNAWWSAILPSEIVSATGYPLPVFFQWDDIEYGHRARENGFTTVTLPGAGVWHADFTWKDQDDWSRYFSVRNSLITAALHSGFSGRGLARVLFGRMVAYVTAMQYGLTATAIKGVEDFLAGPEVLRDGGQRALTEVRELRRAYPETVRHSASDVPGMTLRGEDTERADPHPSMLKAVLAKRVLWQLTGRTSGAANVPLEDSQWWHVSRFRKVVVTDASQEGVRIRRFDRDTAVRLVRESAAVCLRLAKEGPAVAAAYRQALPELTSRENWRRLFDGGAE
ncbi:galactofuranosylgalactofuranosylrhamnosyl-N-acetylglucosaminyl-diphospho-decaprenol beta-1,5/1,6-galactofuranosyltransferase [Geodermatophilus pulveris]|uniref:Galactofuranosylgalactofuranosylrhamnosyl-N-acetylglucosaminyl-diphospho-decaprenol beta-1,5/1,6-galactofuranosyltransferase n=1 Tax=Geodermatophilus pulveris TaxID=1564159 RepID=A0A239B0C7_9ACTN|nr:glycosyltransferase [Geodermatophilus pulveris]SNS01435.1 galactofuranosylgalactofuranosylrhamnosyl-N-acetylglucosaminyl-diphospho-decaprenol beta-1,5/1,6-galactofuranosyltransferase [Geodermatophilus pulveris]